MVIKIQKLYHQVITLELGTETVQSEDLESKHRIGSTGSLYVYVFHQFLIIWINYLNIHDS